MMFKVLKYRLLQAWYDLCYLCGGNQVLLNDPRWIAQPTSIEDYGGF